MDHRGAIVIEGIDIIIKRDLDKHKALLEKNIIDIQAMNRARGSEIGRKRFYGEQKGKRRYQDDAMDAAIIQMSINITGYSRKILATEELKKFNTNIVDTLTQQLKDYNINLKKLNVIEDKVYNKLN